MINLVDAIKDAVEVFESQDDFLNENYESYEVSKIGNSLYLNCLTQKGDSIQLRIIEDYERRNVVMPKNSREYQKQGGNRELERKFKKQSDSAWKIEVVKKHSGGSYEIGFAGSENHWDKANFTKEFLSVFTTKR